MRIARAAAALAMVSGIVLVTPAAAHADDVRDSQWYLKSLGVSDAHKTATGEGVRIGLVDAGIDPEHPDLGGAIGPGQTFGETANLGSGNGTADAAILAGRGHDDNAGVLGIAPKTEIVPAQIATAGANGQNRSDLVTDAMAYLTEQEVDIIAVALPAGATGNLGEAVQNAVSSGILVVAANGGFEDGDAAFPSVPGVVTTIGSTENDEALPNSAPAPPKEEGVVTLAAPAAELPTANPGGDYASGTDPSFAVMIVAGTMALVKENQPDLGGGDLTDVVRNSASGHGEYDETLGYGVVNPASALEAEGSNREGTALVSTPGNNTTLALIIATAGVLALTALVLTVRLRDRASRRAAVAAAGGELAFNAASGPAPGPGHTGNMPRIPSGPAPGPGHTGNMPRIPAGPAPGPGHTGNMPRITGAPPSGTPAQPPPYGQQPPSQ